MYLRARYTALCRITCWNWLFNDLFCFQNLLFLGTPLRVFACTMHINSLVLSLFWRMTFSEQQKGPWTHPCNVATTASKTDLFLISRLLHTPVPTQEMLRICYLSVFPAVVVHQCQWVLWECLYARKTVPHGNPKANLA